MGLGAREKEMIELKNTWQTGSKGKTYANFKSDGGAILFDRTPDIDTFDHLIKNKDVIDPSNKSPWPGWGRFLSRVNQMFSAQMFPCVGPLPRFVTV